MILTPLEMQQAEARAFNNGVAPADVMEKAGQGLAGVVRQFFPRPGRCLIYCGKGNNAGDALVAGRYLLAAGWEVTVDLAFHPDEMSPLARQNLASLQAESRPDINPLSHSGCDVVLDGLLGLGAQGEPRGIIAEKIQTIRRMRQDGEARVVAVDGPSGLNLESGEALEELCVQADVTVTFGACKTGLLADAATQYVGRLAVVALRDLDVRVDKIDALAATPDLLRPWIPPRNFDSYKGHYGHVAVIAGSPGYFGAARLAALGVLHSGAGLVTVLAKPQAFPYLAMGMPPEVMVKPVDAYREVLEEEFDTIVLGPGLVGEPIPEMSEIMRMASCPMVLDAGAFDSLAGNLKLLRLVAAPRILTPHPGEMARIYRLPDASRADLVRTFVEEFPSVLLLKGARTLVGAPGRPLIYNTTGTPGMGSGGMGDVLAGVLGGLAAQGLRPSQAAALAAWLCGRAAEIAMTENESEESLSATHIPQFLGAAFQSLRLQGW
jgi:hydroxyethylthiazole kinase-like uncharacterized protein yjeF